MNDLTPAATTDVKKAVDTNINWFTAGAMLAVAVVNNINKNKAKN